ncbi:MAG: phosphoglycerate dehydrogenase [Chloroflexota bacterium]|nr:phosphoglycerate dehydrogenase [Chloroflexota bacterium]
MAFKILVSDPIAESGIELLRSKGASVDVKLGLKPEELKGIIGQYDALVVRSETKVTAPIIEAAKKLQVIGRAGVGVDNIDLEAATRRGIVVVYAPTGNTASAAEHTIALMTSLARHVPQAHASLKGGEWRRNEFMGIEVRRKTLGLVGLGRVGSEVAKRAKGLEMKVVAYDPFVSPTYAHTLGVELVSMEELLRTADFISVHTPLTSQTKSLIGAKELELVKPTVRIINVARGGIVDEEALYHAVEEGKVAGAAIDVFSQEPARDNILFKSPKIIVTPHLGASTAEAQEGVAVDVAEEVLSVLEGHPARYAANLPLIPPEALSFLTPLVGVASQIGSLAGQLAEGQLTSVLLHFDGEIANYDTNILKAAALAGLLGPSTEERINQVNVNTVVANRGLRVMEHKGPDAGNYSSLITIQVTTDKGETVVAGTRLRDEVHILRVGDYWLDIVPRGGYWLFCDHLDRPGLIGAVGAITGQAKVNISFMLVARLKPQGQALMVLSVDQPLSEQQRQQVLAIPDVYTAKVVKL